MSRHSNPIPRSSDVFTKLPDFPHLCLSRSLLALTLTLTGSIDTPRHFHNELARIVGILAACERAFDGRACTRHKGERRAASVFKIGARKRKTGKDSVCICWSTKSMSESVTYLVAL